ncbi:MAG TPA: DUF1830 domain-containing protein [Allocoleopsis sp.]
MHSTFTPSRESALPESHHRILCIYTNSSDRIQVIRLKHHPELHFERIVFPSQRLLFEAVPDTYLAIYSSETVSTLIPCSQLRVLQSSDA